MWFFYDLFVIFYYADENTPFFLEWRFKWCYIEIQNASKTIFKRFNDNQMKANPDKSHFICTSRVKTSIRIENEPIRNSSCKKLLGVLFDNKLTFQSHIDNLCQKASQTLNAISRVTSYMDFDKKKISCKCFFYGCFFNKNKINRLHEKYLQLIYCDKRSSVEDLLEKDNSVSIHNKKLQVLAIEMFRLHTKTSPAIMQEVFLVKEQRN